MVYLKKIIIIVPYQYDKEHNLYSDIVFNANLSLLNSIQLSWHVSVL